MTFTELEYVLLIAVAVLLWRISSANQRIDWLVRRSDRYADFLIRVGRGEGRVVLNDDDTFEFKPRKERS